MNDFKWIALLAAVVLVGGLYLYFTVASGPLALLAKPLAVGATLFVGYAVFCRMREG